MKIKEILREWVIPPALYKQLNRVKNYFRYQKHKKVLARNIIFKNKHQGGKCIILLTGRSIMDVNLSLYDKYVKIAVSDFFLYPNVEQLNISYYCIGQHHPPFTPTDIKRRFKSVDSKMPKNCVIFISIKDKNIVEEENLFKGREIYYYTHTNSSEFQEIDLCKPIPSVQSVSILALYVAIYMGFQEIYLLGCDHDWLAKPSYKYEYKHFYNEATQKALSIGQEPPPASYEELLICALNLWKQYKFIQKLAQKKNIIIYNATKDSYLDIFPFINLNDVK